MRLCPCPIVDGNATPPPRFFLEMFVYHVYIIYKNMNNLPLAPLPVKISAGALEI